MPNENIERRFTAMDAGPVELEQRDSEGPKIKGLAVVYYDGTPRTEYEIAPGVVERVRPGAFAELLREGTDTMALFNHDPNNVLGRTAEAKTLRLKSTRRGLEYEIDPPDTQIGRDVVENLRRRDVSGSSFAFMMDPEGEKWKKDKDRDLDVREIVKVARLFDVGPVTNPAYTATEAALRSLDMTAETVPTPPDAEAPADAPEDEDEPAPKDTDDPERDAKAAEDEARLHRFAAIKARIKA